MKIVKLLIADTDLLYGEALASYLISKHSDKFKTILCSRREIIENVINQENNIEIILCCEEFYETLKSKSKFTIILDTNTYSRKITDDKRLYKYLTAEEIICEVIDEFISNRNSITSIKKNNSTEVKVIGVLSVAGGTGKSLVASMLACFAIQSFKVLFLSLEANQASEQFFPDIKKKSISSVLMSLYENQEILDSRITASICNDDTRPDYFTKPISIFDVTECKYEHIFKLLDALKRSIGYDLIIVDIDNVITRDKLAFMDNFNSLLLVHKNGITQEIKLQSFIGELSMNDESRKILSKISIVNNYSRDIYSGTENSVLNGSFYVPYIENIDQIQITLPFSDIELCKSLDTILKSIVGG